MTTLDGGGGWWVGVIDGSKRRGTARCENYRTFDINTRGASQILNEKNTGEEEGWILFDCWLMVTIW